MSHLLPPASAAPLGLPTDQATPLTRSVALCGRPPCGRRGLPTDQATIRIAVIGTSGSGKTTLACRQSERLGVPHVELDALHWGPNWTPAEPQVFRERTAQALSGDAWVTDGNYSAVREIVWGRANTVVWLDFSLPVIMGRMLKRTLRRMVKHEELWNQNRESFAGAFLHRDSIILWALRTYRRRRREYPQFLARAEYAHLHLVRLRSPWDAQRWLENCGWPCGSET